MKLKLVFELVFLFRRIADYAPKLIVLAAAFK